MQHLYKSLNLVTADDRFKLLSAGMLSCESGNRWEPHEVSATKTVSFEKTAKTDCLNGWSTNAHSFQKFSACVCHADAMCFWWKVCPTWMIRITDKRRWRRMEGRKVESERSRINIFTSLHSTLLSPRGVARKGWPTSWTAWILVWEERRDGRSYCHL